MLPNRDHDLTQPVPSTSVSRTSQVMALIRSELNRPHGPEGDPDAQKQLCKGMRPFSYGSVLKPNIIKRTPFFDEQVLNAIRESVHQVVILGAGYDDRALRFRAKDVHFFELDHPTTQSDKARRLREMKTDVQNLTLVPADFRSDDVAALLRSYGHREDQPSLFICEGLLVYLDLETGQRLLSGLRSCAAGGSKLAASLAVARHGETSNEVVTSLNASRRFLGEVEPWITLLPVDEYLAFFERSDWRVDLGVELANVNDSTSRMLLVTAHL